MTGLKRVDLADILSLQPLLIYRALRPVQGALEEFIKRVWHGDRKNQMFGGVNNRPVVKR
jgi:hypothetical protein